MKLRRLQKALCCKYSLSIYTCACAYIFSWIRMCHIGFLSLASSTLLSYYECSSLCIPALPHSSFVLYFPPSPVSFLNSPHLRWFLLHRLLFTLPLCLFFFPPPPFLFSTYTIFASLPSQSECVCVHMCVYSSFLSLTGGSVECEPPTSCYVCDMF